MNNDPGQDRVRYRVGTHQTFRRSMLAALGEQPALAALTTRDDDDPAIALADAWASVLDVVTFSVERAVNEVFVRTATERESVLLLARAIGYELRPGVAATTWLSFTVSETPGAPPTVPIPVGSQAQSVPGPGEMPQVFETVEPLAARPALNSVPVMVFTPHSPASEEAVLRLLRTDLLLQAGDALVILAGGESPWSDVRRVREATVVEAEYAAIGDPTPLVPAYTLVTLDGPIDPTLLDAAAAAHVSGVEVHVLRQRAPLFGYNAPPWRALPVALRVGELNPHVFDASDNIELRAAVVKATATPVERVDRVLDGYYYNRQHSWNHTPFAAGTMEFHLDQAYPKVVTGSWVVLEGAGVRAVRYVAAVVEEPKSDFGLSARTTKVTVAGGDVAGFAPTTTIVLCQSERLALAGTPLAETLSSVDYLDLAVPVGEVEPGRTVAVTGLSPAGQPVSEIVTVESVSAGPKLYLNRTLSHAYRRSSVRVLGNVAKATHGQSRAEVLGSGDQRIAFQTFTLSQAPLTYVAASTPSGIRTTLAVWVDGVRWHEVATLHGQPPAARVYVVRRSDDGTVRVTFGDNRTGARLSTGRDNVIATYRVDIGRAALFTPGRLTIPLSRPLGLMEVTNPVPADGADDPETIDQARRNAPLAVRTLGRVVSLDDYADFARAFAGVGKARADLVWDGERRVVLLTLAGPDGAPVPDGSALHTDLTAALDAARHATVRVVPMGYHAKRVAVRARLVVTGDRRFSDVAAVARATLLNRFSFARRDFAQPVLASEVLATLQAVPGVIGAVLEALHDADDTATREDIVRAEPARRLGSDTWPADLLTLDSTAVDLVEGTQ